MISTKLKTTISALLLGASLSATSLFANSIIIHDSIYDGLAGNYNQGAQGGEFRAQILDNGTLPKNMTFGTFCLENFIHIDMEKVYTYSVDSRALSGATDNHDIPGNPFGDPLSKGTVYLYTAFIKKTLPDHLVGGVPVGNYLDNHDRNAGLLQRAIWTLEDEYNYNKPQFDYGLGYNPYLNLVFNMFGTAGAYQNATGGNVKVLNIWGPKHKDIQSLLVYVPDNGMTAALLGIGLLSLAAFRRKL